MIQKYKNNIILTLILVFIMLFSSVGASYTQPIDDNTDDTYEEDSANSEEIEPIEKLAVNLDIQVCNVNDLIWKNELDVYTGDIVRFRIIIENVILHDLVDVNVLNEIPSSDILEYVTDSCRVNDISSGFKLIENQEKTFYVWDFTDLSSDDHIIITYDMLALQETTISGIQNTVSISCNLNNKYQKEINDLRLRVEELNLEMQILQDKTTAEETNLILLNDKYQEILAQEQVIFANITSIDKKISENDLKLLGLQEIIDLSNNKIIDYDNQISLKNQDLEQVKIDINEKTAIYETACVYYQEQLGVYNTLSEELQVLNDLYEKELSNSDEQNIIVTNLKNQIAQKENDLAVAEESLIGAQQVLNTYNTDLNNLEIQETEIQNDLSLLENQYNLAVSAKNDYEIEYNTISKTISDLTNQKEKEQQNLLNTKIEKSDKQALLNSYNSELASLESKSFSLSESISNLESEISSNLVKIDEYESLIVSKDLEIIQLQDDKSLKENDIAIINQKISDLEDELVVINQKIPDLQNSENTIQSQIDQYYIQLNEAYEQLPDDTIQSLLSEINTLEITADNLRQDITDYENQNIVLSLELESYKTIDAQLSADIKKINDDILLLENSQQILENKILESSQKISNINSEIISYKSTVQQLQQTLTNKEYLLSDAQEKISSYNTQEQNLIIKINDYIDKINLKTQDQINYQTEYESTIQTISSLENEKAIKLQDATDLQITIDSKIQEFNNINLILNNLYTEYDGTVAQINEKYILLDQAYENQAVQNQIINDLLTQISNKESELGICQSDITLIENEKAQKNTLLNDYKTTEQVIIQNIADLQNQINTLSLAIDGYESSLIIVNENIVLTTEEYDNIFAENELNNQKITNVENQLFLKQQEYNDLDYQIKQNQLAISEKIDILTVLYSDKDTKTTELDNLKQIINAENTGSDVQTSSTGGSYPDSSSSSNPLPESGDSSQDVDNTNPDSSNAEIQEQIYQLESEIRIIDEQIQQKEDEIDDLIILNEGLLIQKNSVDNDILNLEVKKQNYLDQKTIYENKLIELQNKIADYQTEKSTLEQNIQDNNDQITILSNSKNLEQIKLTDTQTLITQVENEIVSLDSSLNQLINIESMLLGELDQLNLDLQTEYEKLNDGYIDTLLGQINTLESEKTALSTDITYNEQLKTTLSNEISDCENSLQIINNDIDDLTYQINIKNQRKSELEILLQDIEDKIILFTNEKNNAEIELQNTRTLRDEQIILVDSLHTDILQLNQDIEYNNNMITSLEQDKLFYENEKNTYQTEYDENSITITGLLSEKTQKTYEKESNQASIDSTTLSINENNDNINLLNSELEPVLLSISQKYADLEIQYQKQEEQNSIISNLKTQIESAGIQLLNTQNELNDYIALKNTKTGELEQYTITKTTLSDELLTITINLDNAENQKNDYILKKENLEDENIILSNNKQLKIDEKNTVDQKIIELKDTLIPDLTNAINLLIDKENLLLQTISNLEIDIASNIQKQNELMDSINICENNILDLSNQKDTKQKQLDDKNLEISKQKTLIESQTITVNQIQQTVDSTKSELNDLYVLLTSAIENSDSHSEKLIELENQINLKQQAVSSQDLIVQQALEDKNSYETAVFNLNKIKNGIETDIQDINTAIELEVATITQAEADKQTILLENAELNDNKIIFENKLDDITIDKNKNLAEQQTCEDTISKLKDDYNLDFTEKENLENDIKIKEEKINGIVYKNQASVTIFVTPEPVEDVISYEVDKKVYNEKLGIWAESTEIYTGMNARFKITVKNKGNVGIPIILAKDVLPEKNLIYNGNATPNDPKIVDDELIWEINDLEPEGLYYIEFDALSISEGNGDNTVQITSSRQIDDLQEDIIYAQDTANVQVNMIPVPENVPPTAFDDYEIVKEDSVDNIFDVLANDTDENSGDILTIESIESAPINGTAYISSENTILYSPNTDFFGQDSLTYKISDGAGGYDTAVVFIEVINLNDAPIAVNDEASTLKNKLVSINVLENDYDIEGDELTIQEIFEHPSNGTALIDLDGNISYTPDADFVGVDSLSYNISDGNGGIATGLVEIDVIKIVVNHPPVALDDSYTVKVNSTDNIFDVLSNDKDIDNDPITIDSIDLEPNNGTVTIVDNKIVYTPDPGYNGTDSFTYNISDDKDQYDTAVVTIKVEYDADLINSPEKGYVYILNKEVIKLANLMNILKCDCLAIGPITTIIDTNNTGITNVERVEFYVNDELAWNTSNTPYEYTINEPMIGRANIKTILYGDGQELSDEINVLVLNLGLMSDEEEQ